MDTATPAITEFGRLLRSRWAALGLSQAAFARRVGAPAGWIQQIRTGRKRPPLPRVPAWADALELVGDDRLLFLEIAALMHVPARHRPMLIEHVRARRPAALALARVLDAEERAPPASA